MVALTPPAEQRIQQKASSTVLQFAKCIALDLEAVGLNRNQALTTSAAGCLTPCLALLAIAMGKAVPSGEQTERLMENLLADMKRNLTDAK